jgi:ABC-2 type transport system permease protein
MNNILLIIQREYLTRVKKKSFIVMTILGPLLMGLMYAGVIWAAISSVDQKKVEVLDESKLFEGKFKPSNEFQFVFAKGNIDEIKKTLKGSGYDALVHIPANVLENPKNIKIYSEKGVTLELQNKVENAIEKEIETIKLTEAGITKSVLESAKMDVSSETISLKEK